MYKLFLKTKYRFSVMFSDHFKINGVVFFMEVRMKKEEIYYMSLDKLKPYSKHPFAMKDDEEMANLRKSINDNGIIEPLIVRKSKDNKYEIISGHRRYHICKKEKIDELPVKVVDLDDDTTAIIVVDSNMKRENVLISEKAFAYKLKFEALKHQGKIDDVLASYPLGTKYKTDTAIRIANEEGTSRRQIYRYIRLTNLNKDLLKLVDKKRISFNPAVELSYLNEEQQDILLEVINDLNATPSFSQAQYLRNIAQEGKYTEDIVYDVLETIKPNQKEKLKIDMEDLKDYFDRGTTPNEMIKIIKKSLSQYRSKQKSKKEENDLKI